MAVRIAVVGTGTELGKTHVGCALVAAWRGGRRVLALKPVESGGDADARALSEACGIATPPLFGFEDALSPHLAAQRAGRTIAVDAIVDWVNTRERELGADTTLIETAGGLFSPLAPHTTNATLVAALEVDVMVLVAPDRLGVLHDVTAVSRAWPERPPTLVVLSAPAVPDGSTGGNATELALLSIADVVACFPRAPLASEPTRAAAERLARAVRATLALKA